MKIFFDTEFANIEPDKNGNRYLISIGCVSDDGREFYAELTDTWDDHLCSMLVIDTVLPLLQGGEYRMGISQLAIRLKEWIESFTDKKVVFHSDAPSYDWPFVQEIFNHNGWPENLNKNCIAIYGSKDLDIPCYEIAMEQYWKEHADRQHHALVDARGMQTAWGVAMDSVKAQAGVICPAA